MGAEDGRTAEAASGELVITVPLDEGYRLWSESYDFAPNPVLALERRVVAKRLGSLNGCRFLDIATGTGYWLSFAQLRGAIGFGVDRSAAMLSRASARPGVSSRLVRADLNALPFRSAIADLAICSFALGYTQRIEEAFRELARVARTVIVSELHESAVHEGWERAFRANGSAYRIEQYPHGFDQIQRAAHSARLTFRWREDAHFAETERNCFVLAGRESAFAAAARVPAILTTCWTRQ